MKRTCLCFFMLFLLLLPVMAPAEAVIQIIVPPTSTPAPGAEPEPTPAPTEDPWPFIIRYGSREENKIALSMDDCYELDKVEETLEICREFGIIMTFYPLGLVLKEEDRELWQSVIDAGCEIGTHTMRHASINKGDARVLLAQILRPQEVLDQVLGYHYPIRTLRPPYGRVEDENGSTRMAYAALKLAGFDHVVNWDVSQTDPVLAAPRVQNGSILLYHARRKDVECIRQLVPVLLEKGFEFVTVAELIGLPREVETSPEKYVYNPDDYFR